MDRLLVVIPMELRFNFEPGKKASAKIRLQSLMHTMPVAFKLWTTAPKKYTICSQAHIIPPLGEHVVEITMAAQNSFPDGFPHSHDRVYVKSLMIPTGRATQSELSLWFSTRKKHVFTDATLTVILTGNHVLWRLAVSGSAESLREVLRDTNVNARDGQDRTPLFIAAVQGNVDAVRALLESKADVNCKDKTGQMPLFEAVLAGHSEVFKLLLDAGAETGHKDCHGRTCLHAAALWNRTNIMRMLLDAGADINAVDDKKRTPLHEAVSGGHFKACVMLVQCGADIGKKCADDFTALHIAAASGFEDIADFLLKEGADINVRNNNRKSPHDLARENGQSSLLDAVHVQEMLQKAARTNDLEIVQDCLLGAVTDVTDQHGWTALHRASFKGHADVVRLLLKHQFDINVKDEKGYTPLHCAIEAGHQKVVELLLEHGADASRRINEGGLTPLGLALTTKYSGIHQLIKAAKPDCCKGQ